MEAAAISAAIAAFFNFLSTPAGQMMAVDFVESDHAFKGKVKDMFDRLHDQITPAAAAPKGE